MTSPLPGITYPQPRTWEAGDPVTVPRLRGDGYNMAALSFGGAKPLLKAGNSSGTIPSQEPNGFVFFTTAALNSWNVNVVTPAFDNQWYPVPLAGWYLVHGDIVLSVASSSGPADSSFTTSLTFLQNGGTIITAGGILAGSSASTQLIGATATELIQLNPGTTDSVAMGAYQTTTAAAPINNASLMVEWVGLPTDTITPYTGPYGVVVTDPQPALPFPAPATTLSGTIAAGGTVAAVTLPQSIVTGATIGLGYQNGQPWVPGAETVTVTSAGGTLTGITATSYPHAAGEPVAVPVSAAFMNAQLRDAVNFLACPPMFRAYQTSAQSIPSGDATQLTGWTVTQDNFSGWNSSENYWVAPVSGVYLIYGLAALTGSTSGFEYGVAVSISDGTLQYGQYSYCDAPSPHVGSAVPVAAPFRRHMRLTAGETVALYGQQNCGAAMDTTTSSLLIIVFRSF